MESGGFCQIRGARARYPGKAGRLMKKIKASNILRISLIFVIIVVIMGRLPSNTAIAADVIDISLWVYGADLESGAPF